MCHYIVTMAMYYCHHGNALLLPWQYVMIVVVYFVRGPWVQVGKYQAELLGPEELNNPRKYNWL